MNRTLPDPTYTVGLMPSASRLRAALRANVAFSLLSGLLLLFSGGMVARWGLGPWWLASVVGFSLLPFAAIVARVAVLPAIGLRNPARLVVAADLAWVVASIVLLAVVDLPGSGATLVTVVAGVVAVMAVWQILGLAGLDEDDPLGDVEVVESSRLIEGPPEKIWPLITDHALYGRLAPNLSAVEVISQTGERLRRRCISGSGGAWEEACTLWDENHRYGVEVDTGDYPYPIEVMRGLWQVDPDPVGSRVTMRFTHQAEPTIWGGLFSVAFRPLFPLILGRIFRGWQEELAGR